MPRWAALHPRREFIRSRVRVLSPRRNGPEECAPAARRALWQGRDVARGFRKWHVSRRACDARGLRGETLSAPNKKSICALIVDDEELARHVLRELIAAHSEIEVAAECANGFEA